MIEQITIAFATFLSKSVKIIKYQIFNAFALENTQRIYLEYIYKKRHIIKLNHRFHLFHFITSKTHGRFLHRLAAREELERQHRALEQQQRLERLKAGPTEGMQSSPPGSHVGGGFKYFLFSHLFGEDFQFDLFFSDGLKPPARLNWM